MFQVFSLAATLGPAGKHDLRQPRTGDAAVGGENGFSPAFSGGGLDMRQPQRFVPRPVGVNTAAPNRAKCSATRLFPLATPPVRPMICMKL